MKVLVFIAQFYRLGGAERLDIEFAEELNKRGIHADILSMYAKDLPGVPEATSRLLMRGIPSVRFLGMKVNPSFASIFPAILKLKRLIRGGNYDIVTTSGVSPTILTSWSTFAKRTFHVAGLHRVYLKETENTLQHKVWRFSVRCNNEIKFYAISNYVADAWIRYSGTKSANTRTIYNAINDDFFKAKPDRYRLRYELGIPENSHIAIYVGRLAKIKGTDTLFEALGPILKSKNVYLLIAGVPDPTVKGTRELIRKMKYDIRQIGCSERIRFLGFREDVPRLLASSDVLVHPSRREGFGLTLVEAMAAGIPVVASNVEGIPEVLDGTDNSMVPPEDPQELRKAVLDILCRPENNLANAIRKGRMVAEKYRLNHRTDRMVELFNELLNFRL